MSRRFFQAAFQVAALLLLACGTPLCAQEAAPQQGGGLGMPGMKTMSNGTMTQDFHHQQR
jgi:hypothetical protein